MYKYILVGILNTALGLSIIYILMFFLKMNPIHSNIIGYLFGSLFGYFANSKWTFGQYKKSKSQVFFYYSAILISYLLNLTVVALGFNFLGLNKYAMQIVGVLVYTISSYLILKLFVFNGAYLDEN